jgi:hypothetical protein
MPGRVVSRRHLMRQPLRNITTTGAHGTGPRWLTTRSPQCTQVPTQVPHLGPGSFPHALGQLHHKHLQHRLGRTLSPRRPSLLQRRDKRRWQRIGPRRAGHPVHSRRGWERPQRGGDWAELGEGTEQSPQRMQGGRDCTEAEGSHVRCEVGVNCIQRHVWAQLASVLPSEAKDPIRIKKKRKMKPAFPQTANHPSWVGVGVGAEFLRISCTC